MFVKQFKSWLVRLLWFPVDGARSKSNRGCFTLFIVESILEEKKEKVIVAYLVNFTFIFINNNVAGYVANERFFCRECREECSTSNTLPL